MKTRFNTRRDRVRVALAATGVTLTLALSAACTGTSSAPDATAQGDQVSNATYNEFNKAVPYPYADAAPSNPLERQNLSKRLTQYNSQGDTNYVYIFAPGSAAGGSQVVGYYVINGKVSSTGSEMTATQITASCNTSQGACGEVLDAVGDDGTYGPEEGGSSGVFFFTSTGALVETDLPFLVSSAPIKLYSSVPQLDAPVG